MGDTAASLGDLAKACLNQANKLQEMQQDLKYQGPQIAPLYANETALRSKVLLLNVAAVSAALAASADAQKQLAAGTAAAQKTIDVITDVGDALQISGDLLGLAASALSGSPTSVISSAAQLITDATALSGKKTGGKKAGAAKPAGKK